VPVCCAPETCTSERRASLVVARPPALRAAQAVAAGAAKAALPAGTTFVLGVVAGAFIGFGSFLALSVGGACPGLASANPGLQKMVLVRTLARALLRWVACRCSRAAADGKALLSGVRLCKRLARRVTAQVPVSDRVPCALLGPVHTVNVLAARCAGCVRAALWAAHGADLRRRALHGQHGARDCRGAAAPPAPALARPERLPARALIDAVPRPVSRLFFFFFFLGGSLARPHAVRSLHAPCSRPHTRPCGAGGDASTAGHKAAASRPAPTSGAAAQMYEGKATPGQLIKNWLASYAGNFVGSVALVALVAASGAMAASQAPAAVAVAKTSLSFSQARQDAVAAAARQPGAGRLPGSPLLGGGLCAWRMGRDDALAGLSNGTHGALAAAAASPVLCGRARRGDRKACDAPLGACPRVWGCRA